MPECSRPASVTGPSAPPHRSGQLGPGSACMGVCPSARVTWRNLKESAGLLGCGRLTSTQPHQGCD